MNHQVRMNNQERTTLQFLIELACRNTKDVKGWLNGSLVRLTEVRELHIPVDDELESTGDVEAMLNSEWNNRGQNQFRVWEEPTIQLKCFVELHNPEIDPVLHTDCWFESIGLQLDFLPSQFVVLNEVNLS